MHFEFNLSKFNFIYLPKAFLSSLPSLTNSSDLAFHLFSTIRSLGFYFDSSLSFKTQIYFVDFSCFYYLCHIKQISLFTFFLFLSCFDYCNSLYYNFLKATFYRLTKASNTATYLVFYIFPSLIDLYWLPFHYRYSKKLYFHVQNLFL